MASTRYRAALPGHALVALGHDVSIGYPRDDADVTVFSKHFSPNDVDLIRRQSGRRVMDVCDDHFQTQHREHYLRMIELADVVTCSTSRMAEVIKEEAGVDALVVPDPYEFPELPPHRSFRAKPRLLWFGHAVNLDTLEPLIWSLKDYDVKLVCNKLPPRFDLNWIRYEPWGFEAMTNSFDRCDLVFLPTSPKQRRKSVKSHNRPLEAIRQGRYVVMGHLPSYEQFGEWMYVGDNVKEAIDRAVQEPERCAERVREAQAFIRSRYSPEVVARYWLRAFEGEPE